MRPLPRQLGRALRAEAGIALPVALAVLVITILLASVAAAIATDTSRVSNRDTGLKAAVAAADAGARTAIYRLSAFHPDVGYCPTPANDAVGGSGAPTTKLCAPVSETLGNGAQFTYWVSDALSQSDSCTGSWMSSVLGDIQQRCVTAVGTANGVSARIQERVATYTSWAAFPTAIFGTASVTIDNNVNMVTDTPNDHALLGTNGYLNAAPTGGGTTVIDGYQLPPGATVNVGQNVTNTGPTTGIGGPYPVPSAVNPGYTANNTPPGGTCAGLTPLTQTNCNYRINCPDAADCDPHLGTINFDAAHRTLYLANNSLLTLGGGYYNFCSLYLSNNSVILIAPPPGTQTSIYIDSPSDPDSGCSTSNSAQGIAPGTFTMSQGSSLNAGGDALNANVYVYGDPNDSPPTNVVSLQNVGSSSYTLQAPYSNITLAPDNNATFKGAIVGYTVTLGNKSHFTYEADTGPIQGNTVDVYYRSYYEQCPATYTGTDPTSGC